MENKNDKRTSTKKDLARDFLLLGVGDRIQSISFYEEKYQVSRGTIQNAMKSLINDGSLEIISYGRNGSYIKKIDYKKLQNDFGIGTLVGALTMPSSLTTKALVTALYKTLDVLDCNIVYSRNASERIKMLKQNKCDFTVCSMHSALKYSMIEDNIKILFNFGPNTYTSERVKIFTDKNKTDFDYNMRIAYDPKNDDYVDLMKEVVGKDSGYNFINIKTQQIPKAIKSGTIDAAIWAIDELQKSDENTFGSTKITLPTVVDYTTAVLIIRNNDSLTQGLLEKYINISNIIKLQYSVINNLMEPDY